MARLFRTSVDLGWLELLKLRLQNLAADPANPEPGWMYFNTTNNVIRLCVSTDPDTWVDLGEAGGGTVTSVGAAAPITSTGGTAPVIGITPATTGAAGSMSAADKTKLDGIEDGATADMTGAEIKVAYEGEADTNAFTDAEKSKLGGIEAGATADQTAAEILAALLTVDDDESGLNATTLQGQTPTQLSNAIISAITDGAPATLDTLNEIAAALQNDPNIITALQNGLAARTRQYAALVGDGSSAQITVVHDLDTEFVQVTTRFAGGTKQVFDVDWRVIDADTIRLDFASSDIPAANEVAVVVTGVAGFTV